MVTRCDYACIVWIIISVAGSQRLPEYVTSECYGNSFNFECGQGHKIRINRDFFGHSSQDICEPSINDCVIANQKTDSLIHRYCTGKRRCPYFQVERRACNGVFTNYQQVEYQCVPDSRIVDICQNIDFETREVFISSTNFPQNYPPGLDCSCFVSSSGAGALVHLEVVYMSILYSFPCRDWLRVGRTRMCGITVDLFSGQHIPLEFHSDHKGGHSGFWLHVQASQSDASLYIRCRNSTLQSMFSEQRSRFNSKSPRFQNSFTSPSTSNVPLPEGRHTKLPVTDHQPNQHFHHTPPVEGHKGTYSMATPTKESSQSSTNPLLQGSKQELGNEKMSTHSLDTPLDIGALYVVPSDNIDKTFDSSNFYSNTPFSLNKNKKQDTGEEENQKEDSVYDGVIPGFIKGTKKDNIKVTNRLENHATDSSTENGYSSTSPYHNKYDTDMTDSHHEMDIDDTNKVDMKPVNVKDTLTDKIMSNAKQSTFPSTVISDGYEELESYNNDNDDLLNDSLLHTVHSFSPYVPDYHSIDIPDAGKFNFEDKETARKAEESLGTVDKHSETDTKRMTTPPVTFNIQQFIQRKLNGSDSELSHDHRKIKEIYSKMTFPVKVSTKDIRGEKTKPPDILTQLNIYNQEQIPPVKPPQESRGKEAAAKALDNSDGLIAETHLSPSNLDISQTLQTITVSGRGNESPLDIYPDTADDISNIGTNINPQQHRRNGGVLESSHVEGPHSGFPLPIDHSVDKGTASTIYKHINGASTGQMEQNFNTYNENKDLQQEMELSPHGHLQRPPSREQDYKGDGLDLDYFNTLTASNYSVNLSIPLNDSVPSSTDKPISLLESSEQLFPPRNDMINASLSSKPEREWNINEPPATIKTQNLTGNYPQIMPTQATHRHLSNTQMSPTGPNYDKSDLQAPLDLNIASEDIEISKYAQSDSAAEHKNDSRNKTPNNSPANNAKINLQNNDHYSWKIISQPVTPLNGDGLLNKKPKKHSYYYYYYDHYSENGKSLKPPDNNYKLYQDDINIGPTTKDTTLDTNNKNPTRNHLDTHMQTSTGYRDVSKGAAEEIGKLKDTSIETPHPSKNNYSRQQFDNSKKTHVVDHITNEPINARAVKPVQTTSSWVQGHNPGDQVQSQTTESLWQVTTEEVAPGEFRGFTVEDSNAWSVTHANEDSGMGLSPRDDRPNDRVVPSGGEGGTDKKEDTNTIESVMSTESTTDVLESSYDESSSIVTLGLIILSICIGAGIILLSCFFIAILWHRRRRRIATSQRPTLAIIHAQKEMLNSQQTDGDSGRSLLVHAQKSQDSAKIDSYAKGRGHQSVLDVDSVYSKPKKKDKMLQIDMTDVYEDVAIHKQKKPQSHTKKTSPRVGPHITSQNCGTAANTGLSESHLGKFNIQSERSHQRDMFLMPNNTYSLRRTMPITTIKEEEFENDQTMEEEHMHHQQGDIKPDIPPKPKLLKNIQESVDSGGTECITPFENNSTSSELTMKKKTMASMPGLAEVTFMPENSPVYYEVEETLSDDSDWETRSAISL